MKRWNVIHYLMYAVLGLMLIYQSETIEDKNNLIQRNTDIIQLKDSVISDKNKELESLKENFSTLLRSFEFISNVDVTMYNAVPGQTDDTPLITASGAKINPEIASEHRWIAISRNLQTRWGGKLNFGDIVYVRGTDDYDGFYVVHDNMNARFTDRIDILRSEGEEMFAFTDSSVELYRVESINETRNQYTWQDLQQYVYSK